MEFVRFVLVGAADAGGTVANVGKGVGTVAKRIRFVSGSCCTSLARFVVAAVDTVDTVGTVTTVGIVATSWFVPVCGSCSSSAPMLSFEDDEEEEDDDDDDEEEAEVEDDGPPSPKLADE